MENEQETINVHPFSWLPHPVILNKSSLFERSVSELHIGYLHMVLLIEMV